MPVGALPRFDPSDPAFFADPYPEFARLRAAGPLARGFGGQWVLTRHAEVSAALRDKRLTKLLPATYFEALVGAGPSSDFLARMQELFHDRRVTRVLGRAFNAKFMPKLAHVARSSVESLLEPALRAGRFDAVADVGVPLPVTVVCEVFGIPEPDRDEYRRRVADMVVAYNDSVFAVDPHVAAAREATAHAAVTWQQHKLHELIELRRETPGEDAISALLAVEEDGRRLTDEAIVDSVIMSFYAGFETAMAMITTGLAALSRSPAQWARLRADRSLVRTAIEEFVRLDAPIQIGVRRALAPLDVAGQTIRPGRLLVLLLGSANRDERVFADPDALNVARRPNPHLGFGGGAYYCLGAALARLEGAVTLDVLVRHCRTIEPAGPAVRHPRFNFRTYTSVPLAVTPQ